MISFLSSLLVMASISTNALGAISNSSNSINLKTNNNFFNANSIDLSTINAQVKNKWVNQDTWNQFQLQNANINLDFHVFGPELKTMSWQQVILSNITKGIDYHYNTLENTLYKQKSIFTNLLNQNQAWVTILGQKNATLALNNNNPDILSSFWEPQKNISTFYLRVSNSNSMNWNVNHSYLDVTLNICNFTYDWSKTINNKLIATSAFDSTVSNFNKDSYVSLPDRTQGDTNFATSKLSTTSISPQFKTWANANKFVDFFSFYAYMGDWMYGFFYTNYWNYYYQDYKEEFAINDSTGFKVSNNFLIAKYPQIKSKVTNGIVPANTFDSQIQASKLAASDFFITSYGTIVLDLSYPTTKTQNTDNNLYITAWFYYWGALGSHFHIKVSEANLSMHYNTSVFDNIYKI